MTKLINLSRLFLFLSFLFGSLWLGSYFTRQIVVYQFFEPDGLNLKAIYNQQNLEVVIKTIAPLFVSNLILFLSFILFFISFVLTSKIKLREEGWFLIILLIIIITAPFELYLLYRDYKIINTIYFTVSTSGLELISQIKERMQSLSGFALIEIFSYFGIIFLIIFKPLRKSNEN